MTTDQFPAESGRRIDPHGLRTTIIGVLERMPAHTDELRDLDAALGDGDLGITVSAGSAAVIVAIEQLADSADLEEIMRTVAKAFSTANPSTFSALVGGGLLAGANTFAGRADLGPEDVLAFADTVAERISQRGKAVIGDKTILDALLPSLDAVRDDPTAIDAIEVAIAVALDRVESTAALRSAKGRAAWVQERSIGHRDPGATAYLRFLEELKAVRDR